MPDDANVKKPEYRSSLRSKRLIISAFLELLEHKELDKITVTEVAEKADLNRRTFYAHYSDVRAVMDEIEDQASDTIIGLMTEIDSTSFWENPLGLLTRMTDYLEKDQYMYRIMFNAATAEAFITKIQRKFANYMCSLPFLSEETRRSQKYLNRAYFFAGGIANLYVMWFRGELGGTLADVAETLKDLIINDPIIAEFKTAK